MFHTKYTKYISIGILISFILIHFIILIDQKLAETIVSNLSISSSLDPINIILLPIKAITSTFIHIDISHFLFNLIALISFGQVVEHLVGPKEFLKIYVGSALCGAILFVLINSIYGTTSHAIGASAAIAGLMGFLCVIRPNDIVFFIIFPMSILFATVLFIIISIYFIITMGPGAFNIAHTAHLGGILFGIYYGYNYLNKKYEYLKN